MSSLATGSVTESFVSQCPLPNEPLKNGLWKTNEEYQPEEDVQKRLQNLMPIDLWLAKGAKDVKLRKHLQQRIEEVKDGRKRTSS